MKLEISCFDKAHYRDTKQHIKHVMNFLNEFVPDSTIYDHYWILFTLTISIDVNERAFIRNKLLNVELPPQFTYPIFDGYKTINCVAVMVIKS